MWNPVSDVGSQFCYDRKEDHHNTLVIPPFPSMKGLITMTIVETITHAAASHIPDRKKGEENIESEKYKGIGKKTINVDTRTKT
jgi:hypothetical protein